MFIVRHTLKNMSLEKGIPMFSINVVGFAVMLHNYRADRYSWTIKQSGCANENMCDN